MKSMLLMGMGAGVGYLCTKYNKDIMKALKKTKAAIKKSS